MKPKCKSHRFQIKGSITKDGVRKLHLECSSCGKAKERKQKVSQNACKATERPRTAIRKVSESRKAINKDYAAKRLQFLEEHKTCQMPGCSRPPSDVHHRRGRLGKNMLDVSTWAALCNPCHSYCHENVAWAREQGWIQYQFS